MGQGVTSFEAWDRLHSSMIRALDSYVSLLPVALRDEDTPGAIASRTEGGNLKAIVTAEDALCLALDILEQMKQMMLKLLKELDTERRKAAKIFSASDYVDSMRKLVSMVHNVAVCEQELQVRDNAVNTTTPRHVY